MSKRQSIFRCMVAPPLLLAAANSLAQAPPPLEAYGQLPAVEDIAISPEGTSLALSATVGGERRIAVLGEPTQLRWSIGADAIKFRGLQFIGEDALLLYRSETGDIAGFTADQYEFTQALVFPVAELAAPQVVFGEKRNINSSVFGSYGIRQTSDGWRGYFGALENRRAMDSSYVFDHGRPALYEVDFATMDARRVAESAMEGTARHWLLGRDGTVQATFQIVSETGEWKILNAAGREIVAGRNINGDAGLLGLGAGGQSVLYFQEDPVSGLTLWYETPQAGGATVPFLADVQVERLFWDRASGELLGYEIDASPHQVVFMDAERQRAVRMTLAAFPNVNARIVDWTDDMSQIIVHTSGNADSGTWYLVDIGARRADPLGDDRPGVAPEQVGPISSVAYVAGDGLALDGVLTLPVGREPHNLPLVVLPHGGPHSDDEVQFDWWAQAFASRGYAVFQPNFRGSTGHGEEFVRAGYGQWGRLMQTDISDGVAHLAAQGIIDPARACIVGASYGGYAALAGVTIQQGLYRCAVAVAGVSDLSTMYATDRREAVRNNLLTASLQEELGPRGGWDEVSPRRLAARADAPILLIHGRDDTVVPYEHSTAMADALKDAGKSVRLVELPGEDHWLSFAETRMTMLREAVAFVQEHNSAD